MTSQILTRQISKSQSLSLSLPLSPLSIAYLIRKLSHLPTHIEKRSKKEIVRRCGKSLTN
jgi:hypothetical protein